MKNNKIFFLKKIKTHFLAQLFFLSLVAFSIEAMQNDLQLVLFEWSDSFLIVSKDKTALFLAFKECMDDVSSLEEYIKISCPDYSLETVTNCLSCISFILPEKKFIIDDKRISYEKLDSLKNIYLFAHQYGLRDEFRQKIAEQIIEKLDQQGIDFFEIENDRAIGILKKEDWIMQGYLGSAHTVEDKEMLAKGRFAISNKYTDIAYDNCNSWGHYALLSLQPREPSYKKSFKSLHGLAKPLYSLGWDPSKIESLDLDGIIFDTLDLAYVKKRFASCKAIRCVAKWIKNFDNNDYVMASSWYSNQKIFILDGKFSQYIPFLPLKRIKDLVLPLKRIKDLVEQEKVFALPNERIEKPLYVEGTMIYGWSNEMYYMPIWIYRERLPARNNSKKKLQITPEKIADLQRELRSQEDCKKFIEWIEADVRTRAKSEASRTCNQPVFSLPETMFLSKQFDKAVVSVDNEWFDEINKVAAVIAFERLSKKFYNREFSWLKECGFPDQFLQRATEPSNCNENPVLEVLQRDERKMILNQDDLAIIMQKEPGACMRQIEQTQKELLKRGYFSMWLTFAKHNNLRSFDKTVWPSEFFCKFESVFSYSIFWQPGRILQKKYADPFATTHKHVMQTLLTMHQPDEYADDLRPSIVDITPLERHVLGQRPLFQQYASFSLAALIPLVAYAITRERIAAAAIPFVGTLFLQESLRKKTHSWDSVHTFANPAQQKKYLDSIESALRSYKPQTSQQYCNEESTKQFLDLRPLEKTILAQAPWYEQHGIKFAVACAGICGYLTGSLIS